jgi:amino acid transporter
MKIAILIIVTVLAFFYVAGTSVQFNPFKISINKPYEAIGFVCVAIAFVCFHIQSYDTGYKAGYKKGVKEVIEEVKKANQN